MPRLGPAVLLAAATAFASLATCGAVEDEAECNVFMKLESGRVCGMMRAGANGSRYRSFRGVPYAKQPRGELRFKELQPPEPWDGTLKALEEGPVCPQYDVVYKDMMQPQGMSEACIHANVHIPDIPEAPAWDLMPPYGEDSDSSESTGLPILVMIHGGGFAYGSGDADVNGPELLVSKGVIVITFNYRLNVLGFLSLGSASIPGNLGLRDMVTLLRWVQRNARCFGGDPEDVTLMGQSAGAASAHLLSLSTVAEGLFKRVIIMSGTALPTFYPLTPNYAGYIAKLFLNKTLDTPTTDPEEIHRQLVNMPIDTIMEANKQLQTTMGITAFSPVIESPLPGVTRIIEEDTDKLLRNGRGKDIPLLIGYTNVECETFRPAFENISLVQRILQNNITLLPLNVVFSNILKPDVLPPLVETISKIYFNGNVTMDKFIQLCTQAFFEYPALKVAQYRRESGGAPAYMYRFSYNPDHSVLKKGWGLNYSGAAHHEDLSLVFQINSVDVEPSINDETMKNIMTNFIINFIQCNDPEPGQGCSAGSWPPVSGQKYQCIDSPTDCYVSSVTPAQHQLIRLFDSIRKVR